MKLMITKWLLVYVSEHKHNFHVIHFLSLTVMSAKFHPIMTLYNAGLNGHVGFHLLHKLS